MPQILRMPQSFFLILGFYALVYKEIDFLVFYILNSHLSYMPSFYNIFWGCCNDPYENMFNLTLVTSLVFFFHLRRSKSLLSTLVFICIIGLWYEIGFQLMRLVENTEGIARSSPSLRYDLVINLSSFHNAAKVFAPTSFPSGHGLIYGFFYALCTDLLPGKKGLRLVFFLSLVLCLPRLISGAHAFSDILVGYTFGYLWYWALGRCVHSFLNVRDSLFKANVLSEDFFKSREDRTR